MGTPKMKKTFAKGRPAGTALPGMQKPFKKPKYRTGAESIPPEISASLLAGEGTVPDFPRGGESILSRSEEAQARTEAEEEFEREEREFKKRKDKKRVGRKHGQRQEDELASLFGEGITGKLPRFTNHISLKNISPNMKLLGVVAEVNVEDILISLPGGLRGFVRLEDVSDISSDNNIVHIGQLVPCVVMQVEEDKKEQKGNKRILLSLRLSLLHKGMSLDSVQDEMVLNAQVKSIEDHGYILCFGLSAFSGFLPKDGQEGREVTLKIAQLVQCVVKSVDKARGVVYLSSDAKWVAKSVIKDLKGLSLDALIPGMMVNARVHAVLENGIMLSFLTYFTGTVDIFHMQSLFPNATWKDEYYQNKKVNARILFIDPCTRAVGLTLNPYLVDNISPPSYIKSGDIFDNAKIVRVDKGFGLLLELPSSPKATPAYISRYEAAEKEVDRLDKKFKEDTHVRVRILGFRHVEGAAIGTLKASAFEGSIFTYSDVEPGMVVKAKVIAIESFGAIIQFSSRVKALCPVSHMSELEIAKPPKRFQIGAELLFRVLGCKSKRLTVTCKKSLVKSKLPVVASYCDATEGVITHGWITKIENHGCFVRFYNGVHGFAPRSELVIEPGSEPSSMYHVGQVIKCRIVSSIPASRRINLSFNVSTKRETEREQIKVGTIVSGVVVRLTSGAVILDMHAVSYQKGTIYDEHLADYHGHASLLKSLLKPGYKFDRLVVLDDDGSNLILSAKHSLITSSMELPLDIAKIQPHSVIHGYICNVIGTGCFVRFLGRLTGFSPINKISDGDIDNLSDAFFVGQSVRSRIINVNRDTNRITLSLKQSCCFSTDATFAEGYFVMENKIAELQILDSENSHPSGVRNFSIGQLVEGEIQEEKECGVVLSFKDHNGLVGFVSQHHLGGNFFEMGTSVKALVLDVSATEGLVDLSLKPELLGSFTEVGAKGPSAKKKRRRDASVELELLNTVNAVVEMVKENYLVLSIPQCNNIIGFACLLDYNTQRLPRKNFVEGQTVLATIAALPSSSTSGRLLLLLKYLSEPTKNSSKRAKKASTFAVGAVVEAEITDIKPLELFVKFGDRSHGRVHITEVMDDICCMDNPFSKFRIGQQLTACIVSKSMKSGKGYEWELSIRPSLIAAAAEKPEVSFAGEQFNYFVGQAVRGYVIKVDDEWVSLTLSRVVHAQLYILDSSCEPSELHNFKDRYNVGDAVSGHVICLNKEKKLVRLMSRPSAVANREQSQVDNVRINTKESSGRSLNAAEHILEGDVVGGRIKKILPGVAGILVQIGPRMHGKVHYTELTDTWAANPLSGLEEGQYVKCKILEISHSLEGFVHVDLSLLSSPGIPSGLSAEPDNNDMNSLAKRVEKIEELCPNMHVKGYVKNISPKGCFIMVSRKIDARILLSNLSDGHIENSEMEFPVGKLVHGRILLVEPLSGRVDVTLKTNSGNRIAKSEVSDFNNFHVGDIVSGSIRRIESYGLFIAIDDSNTVGLCHISNLSETPIENIGSRYKAGERVRAKILKVDKERQRISLGMKNLLDVDDDNTSTVSPHKFDNIADGKFSSLDKLLDVHPHINLDMVQDLYSKQVFSASRASVPPLNVKLDDICGSDMDDNQTDIKEDVDVHGANADKNRRHVKRKEREERELVISTSEERRLRNDIPRTADEYEKLVRNSPNSSFLWIKYMAFLLTLADTEKARSVAERALKMITPEQENEKLNVWVAYLNMENEYGNPQEESVRKTFERALDCCDPKKLHLALIGIYEKKEQHDLIDEVLEKTVRRFRKSCKVWLRFVQNLLKRSKDGVQGIVNRALLCLPRSKHIKFISQTAILQFKFGVPDMGRSKFEGILREYPKRTYLWSIYIDQEIRLGDSELIRALFERATSVSLPLKKMKFLLKKYLEYEKSVGDEEKIEYVTRKALEYADSLS